MKKLPLVIAVILIISVVSALIIINFPVKMPSEKVIVTASGIPDEGWKQAYLGQPGDAAFYRCDDAFESSMYQDGPIWPAKMVVDVYHYNSSSGPLSQFQLVNQSDEQHNLISVGDGGFIKQNVTSLRFDTEEYVLFTKGDFLVTIDVGWNNDFSWTEADTLKIAQIQANKIPS